MSKEPTREQIELVLNKYRGGVKSVTRITEGYTHYMYDCAFEDGTEVILRIGYNKKKDYDMAKELWVMERYKEKGVKVPEVYVKDLSRSEFPFEFIVMEKFKGERLDLIWETLSKEDKREITLELSKLMSKLHEVSLDDFGTVINGGVKEEEEFSFRDAGEGLKNSQWDQHLTESYMKDLAGLITYGMLTPEQSAAIVAHLHKNMNLTEGAEPVLIHNDFMLGHVFVTKEDKWKIAGLIDFEFANSHPREFDFVKLHRTGLLDDADFKETFLEGYGREKLSPKFDEVVAFYRLVRDIGFVKFVAKAGNLEVARNALDNVLAKV